MPKVAVPLSYYHFFPELKVLSLCSAGVDHIDPAILNKYGIKMWWAPGINKISVSELAVCYMVFALRRVHFFSSVQEVRGYCRKLIEVVGKSGGFMLDASTGIPETAKNENVFAMFHPAHDFGRYD